MKGKQQQQQQTLNQRDHLKQMAYRWVRESSAKPTRRAPSTSPQYHKHPRSPLSNLKRRQPWWPNKFWNGRSWTGRVRRWHRSARRRLKLPQSRSWYLAQLDCFRSVLLLGKLQSCLPGFCRSQAEFFPFCPRKHFCPARHVYIRRARGPSRRSILSFSPSAFCLIYVFFPLSFVCFFSVFFLFVSLLPFSVWGSMLISWLPLECLLCNGRTSRDP